MAKDAAAQALEELQLKDEWISAIPKKPKVKEEPEDSEEEQKIESLVDILRSQQKTIEDEVQDAPTTQKIEDNNFSYESTKDAGYDSNQEDGYSKAVNAYTQKTATQIMHDMKPKDHTKTMVELSYNG